MAQINAKIDQIDVRKSLMIDAEYTENLNVSSKYKETSTYRGRFNSPIKPRLANNRVTYLLIRQIKLARNINMTSDWDKTVIEFDILLSVPSYQNIIRPFEISVMKKSIGYSSLHWNSGYMDLERFFVENCGDKIISKSIMMQLLQGLNHLGTYNVAFNKDISPNLRIVKDNNGFRLVIVDLRDVKKLEGDMSRSIYVTGIMLLNIYSENLRPDDFMDHRDIFHCLGDSANSDKSDKFLLSTLIFSMTLADSKPSLQSVMEHPYFWRVEKKLNFILTTHHEHHSPPVNGMVEPVNENRLSPNDDVTGTDWRQVQVFVAWKNCPALANKFHNIDNKYYASLKGLVKFFRDKYQHYTHVPEDLQTLMCGAQKDDEKYLEFFTSRFPALLGWLWHSLVPEMTDNLMRQFYTQGPFVESALSGLQIPTSCSPIVI